MTVTTVEGTMQWVDLGTGVWTLVAATGPTYELRGNIPAALKNSGVKARIEGRIRNDVMTIAMVGPVLEIQSCEGLSSD